MLWRREFEKKYGDFNIHVFEGEKFTNADFCAASQSMPFLSEKKLIIIRDFLRDGNIDEQKKVAEELDEAADFCVIVFLETDMPDARTTLFKKLKTAGILQKFEELTGQKYISWIQKSIQQQHGHIGQRESIFLSETVGPNLWQMSQEIEKLAIYANGKPIQTADIEALVTPNLSASIFKLTDAIAQKNAAICLKILKILLESGEAPLGILFMIVRQFRILIEVRACLDQKLSQVEIIQKIKLHPYVVSTSIQQSRNFPLSMLTQIYQKLLHIDSDLKSGKIKITTNDTNEMQMAIEKFITGLCFM